MKRTGDRGRWILRLLRMNERGVGLRDKAANPTYKMLDFYYTNSVGRVSAA